MNEEENKNKSQKQEQNNRCCIIKIGELAGSLCQRFVGQSKPIEENICLIILFFCAFLIGCWDTSNDTIV